MGVVCPSRKIVGRHSKRVKNVSFQIICNVSFTIRLNIDNTTVINKPQNTHEKGNALIQTFFSYEIWCSSVCEYRYYDLSVCDAVWLSVKILKFSRNLSSKLHTILYHCRPGSAVGIATDYGLDGLGSNPGGDEIFRPSIPALGPTQPPVKWVPVLYRG